MASKRRIRRKLFNKSCYGKIRFDDKETADKAMWSYRKAYASRMNSYHCKFCGGYHIGHMPYKVRQSIADKKANQYERK